MKNINFFSTFINWTWELPQTLLGWLFVHVFYKMESLDDHKDVKVGYLARKRFGISLGRYIIIYRRVSNKTLPHEYGHTRQSKMLGPLYLLVVGIPSVVLNVLSRIIRGNFASNYYNRFPENWADKLGNVSR